MAIKVHYQNVNFKLSGATEIKTWLESAVIYEGKVPGEVHYFFIDDNSQREINSEFLEHHYNTDVITFDYSEGNKVSGEIYIAIDTVRNNAHQFSTTFRQEYKRVMLHGVLHLLGYMDRTDEEKMLMRQKEDYYLNKESNGKA